MARKKTENSAKWDDIDPKLIAAVEEEFGPITASEEVKEAVARMLLEGSFEDMLGFSIEDLVQGEPEGDAGRAALSDQAPSGAAPD